MLALRSKSFDGVLKPISKAYVFGLISFRDLEQRSGTTLLRALQKTQQSKSTDQRDRIFALTNLVQDAADAAPAPDYKMTRKEIYLDTAINLIVGQGHVVTILLASKWDVEGQQYLQLPSWVPDWTAVLATISVGAEHCVNAPQVTSEIGIRLTPSRLGITIPCKVHDSIEALHDTGRFTKGGMQLEVDSLGLVLHITLLLTRDTLFGDELNSLQAGSGRSHRLYELNEALSKGLRRLVGGFTDFCVDFPSTPVLSLPPEAEYWLGRIWSLRFNHKSVWEIFADVFASIEVYGPSRMLKRKLWRPKTPKWFAHSYSLSSGREPSTLCAEEDRFGLAFARQRIYKVDRKARVGDKICYLLNCPIPVVLRPLTDNSGYHFMGEVVSESYDKLAAGEVKAGPASSQYSSASGESSIWQADGVDIDKEEVVTIY